MSRSVVIRVEHLSKAYRLGHATTQPDTLAGMLWNGIKTPLRNFRELKNLRRLDRDAETIFRALSDISFEVNEGDVLGVIGRNGAGKSTLLKVLSRITEPSAGKITIRGRVSSLLEVGTGFHPDLTGRENIYMNGTILGMRKREIDRKLDEIIAFSGIEKHIDTAVKRYSSGMAVRLAFSVAAHLEPEILVIDEVLAVGDFEFQKKCLGMMRNVSKQGRTVLFVSHNMGAVKELCTRGMLLKSGSIAFSGTVDDTIRAYVKNRVNAESKGLVDDKMRQHNSGEIYIERMSLTGKDGHLTEDCYYMEDLILGISLKADAYLKRLLIDIKIISEEGIVVLHTLNTMGGRSPVTLTPGHHELKVVLRNSLAPGNYSITAGVHNENGRTIDYVEDVYPFTILKVAGEENQSYKYEWVHGFVHEPGTWELLQ